MNKENLKLLQKSNRLLLETSLTECEIAKSLHISESSLRKIYKDKLRKPPKQYIMHVKFKKAQTLLRTSEKSISEIAYLVGYINASKFSVKFKSIYGINPLEYRKVCRFGVEKNN